jgi:hypothetical protein
VLDAPMAVAQQAERLAEPVARLTANLNGHVLIITPRPGRCDSAPRWPPE